jgi:hypothetical protein
MGGIMDVKAAAIQVMQQAGTALHAKDIAEQIMAAGLWKSGGKTPDATVSARLYADIKRNGTAFTRVWSWCPGHLHPAGMVVRAGLTDMCGNTPSFIVESVTYFGASVGSSPRWPQVPEEKFSYPQEGP